MSGRRGKLSSRLGIVCVVAMAMQFLGLCARLGSCGLAPAAEASTASPIHPAVGAAGWFRARNSRGSLAWVAGFCSGWFGFFCFFCFLRLPNSCFLITSERCVPSNRVQRLSGLVDVAEPEPSRIASNDNSTCLRATPVQGTDGAAQFRVPSYVPKAH